MFHRFEELGPEPRLVRSTDFVYQERAHLSALVRVAQVGYRRDDRTGICERASLPPLDLAYTERTIDLTVRSPDSAVLDGIPGGVDGVAARWVDLDGEGISGVLVPNDRGWHYKANLGAGRLAPPVLQRSLPVPGSLVDGQQLLVDLDGDGRLELVQYGALAPGYFTRTSEGDWTPFAPFLQLPRIDWKDPNLRFLDVDGDGIADVLVTEDEAFVWYRSRGKAGFEPPLVLARPKDEALGAAVVFHDATETIQLADMSGDGLVDIVRLRNGEVCYWPNLGHGRFGRKVTFDQSPWFDDEDQFDPRHIRLADLDGSGTADLVHLGRCGVRIWFNESGNRFSVPTTLDLPIPHTAATIDIVDFLGTGTACLVWSSPLPADGARPLAYIDITGGKKPYLLAQYTNGFGGETRLAYASSTAFYLTDKLEGRPWLTRLPFPVQLLERLERYDHIAGTRLVTRYRYRHGFYDGVEREYRGFAAVEQWDAETIGAAGGLFSDLTRNNQGDLHVPPIRTNTWFHTGAWLDRDLQLALADEYYAADAAAPRLIWPSLPRGLSVAEEREAARALRGRMLRQEIYAEDRRPESIHPYSVTERTFDVRFLEHAADSSSGEGHARGVFFVHPREDLALHYERRAHDPRAQHQLTLEVDAFGNITRTVAIAYPRREPRQPEQERLWATLSEANFVNRAEEDGAYRIGVPIGSATSELRGLPPPRARGLFSVEALRGAVVEAAAIPFEAVASGALQRRLLARRRALYYRDDLRGPLPVGVVGTRAIPYETYEQAFTPSFVAAVYGQDAIATPLLNDAGYVLEDGAFWVPSGRRVFSPAAFYQAVEAIDPFGHRFSIRYDSSALMTVETTDPVGNRMSAVNDYRVLAPKLVTDPNGNRTAALFDALGLPVRIAFMGKEGEDAVDTLEDPSVLVEYDLHRYANSDGKQPIFVHTLTREKHGQENLRWQESYSYRDGSGREAMRKVQAPPGDVPVRTLEGRLTRDETGSIVMRRADERWIGTGRTVFDNKGNPVKKYEPFFSETFSYESEQELVEWGVTPILRYDPLARLIRTDFPDGTLRRVDFHAWLRVAYDANDTVLESQWFVDRGAPDRSGPEPTGDARVRAAWLAAKHANTPSRAHFDSLGRTFLAEVDNGDSAGFYGTRSELDISGNTLAVIDARGIRTVDAQVFDMLGRQLYAQSADAGWSRLLPDVVGKTMRRWTARGNVLRYEYDALRRQTRMFVRSQREREVLATLHVYGEELPHAEARNLRTRTYRTYDSAGIATNEAFDFRGNLSRSSRALAREYKTTIDWSSVPAAEALTPNAASEPFDSVFTIATAYDAIGRVVSRVTPDGSVTRPQYNELNLLTRLDVATRDGERTFVKSIEYNARGQRTRMIRGNGTTTSYHYDKFSFRLHRMRTTRDGARLQDLGYEYDAVGNVVQTRDAVSFGNDTVPADGRYTYDALYRLTLAEGREHPGQVASFVDVDDTDLNHPHDLQAVRRYRETYAYDPVGNISRVAHRVPHGASGGWVREYDYSDASNRLLSTHGPDGEDEVLERFAYDAAGNMTAMTHLHAMRWDDLDRLTSVDRRGGGDVYFAYDAAGQRVRKVYEHSGLIEERVYLDGYEIYRRRRIGHESLLLERETLHVLDSGRRVAMIETKTIDVDDDHADSMSRTRYCLEDALGSSVMELDDAGVIINYEEYLPYGATALRAARRDSKLSAKRYRYTGKERDEETSLYYHGARYYAAWLGRWTACDPAGAIDGFNLYRYVCDNPIGATDPTGRVSWGVIAAVVAVVVVVVVVTVVTAGVGTGPAAAGGAALLGAGEAAALGTTAAVVGTEAAVGTAAAVVGTEAAVGAAAAVVGTEAAVGTTAAVVGTEAAVGTTAAVTGTEAVAGTTAALGTDAAATSLAAGTEAAAGTTLAATTTTGAGTTTLASGVTAAQVTAAGTAVTTAATVAATPAGQQIAEETAEVLEAAGPAVESELEVVAERATTAGSQGISRLADVTYQIIDGVRRAKAASELGQETLAAEVQVAGRTVASGQVSVSSLLSWTKTVIDVSTPTNLQRWLSVLNGTRAGDPLPPIIIQPGTTGTPIPLVGFKF
jgi:RHS repeat-associated protein